MKFTRRRTTGAVLLAISVAAGFAITSGPPFLVVLAALAMVLFLPGRSLYEAVRSGEVSHSPAELIAWSVVASIGISLVGGLLLNLTSGLTRQHWLAWSLATTAIACIACLRPETTSNQESRRTPQSLRQGLAARNLATAGCAVVLIGAALWMSFASAGRQAAGFTQLWIVPSSNSSTPMTGTAQIGIRNLHGGTEQYLVAVFEGQATKETRSWVVSVGAGSTWSTVFPRPVGKQLRVELVTEDGVVRPIQRVLLQPTT